MGLLIGLIIQLIICIQAGKAATSRYTLLKPTNILLTEQFIKPENKIEFSELNVQHSKEINKPISLRIKSETLFTPIFPKIIMDRLEKWDTKDKYSFE